jgi:protein gp37
VPTEWIEAVLRQAWDNPQWNFLFLTKFPIRMAEFEYPPNTWIGTTVDTQYAVERAEKAFRKVRASGYEGIAWLSCEPMMERLTFSSLEMFDWVVMGGASRSTQTPAFAPPYEWHNHLWNQAKKFDLPIYQKTNLIQRGGEAVDFDGRVREYPAKALG